MRSIIFAALLCLAPLAADAAQRRAFEPLDVPSDMNAACGFIPSAGDSRRRSAHEDRYAMLCLGYVQGWAAATLAQRSCVPYSVTGRQLVDIFRAAAASLPNGSSASTSDVFAAALAQLFPCSVK